MLMLTEIKNAGLSGVSPLTKVFQAEFPKCARSVKPDRCGNTGQIDRNNKHKAGSSNAES